MGLRKRKKDQTRSQLLDAALQLISKKGYNQTTVNDIAEAVNVSPRTFLRYFRNKEDVVVDWVDEIMSIFPFKIAELAPGRRPEDALTLAATSMLQAYQDRGSFLQGIEDLIASSPSLRTRKQQRIQAQVEDVAEALRDAYPDIPNITSDILAGTYVAICRASIRQWLAARHPSDIKPIFDQALAKVSFSI